MKPSVFDFTDNEIYLFNEKIEFKSVNECWIWKASLHWKGYGQFAITKNRKTFMYRTHRIAYSFHNEVELSSDQIIDHISKVRSCCNPTHLRIVNNKQNEENRIGAQVNNLSAPGFRGVSKTRSGTYAARVKHNGKKIHIRTFKTAEAAAEAARIKRFELFTHSDGR